MKNLLTKIQSIRVELSETGINKTGKNPHARYEYLELDDFLKPLNEKMLEHKMTALVSFEGDFAVLTAYDLESDETVSIKSPFGSAKLPNCHEVQNIGACETYQRRYLYMALFDICESDALEANTGNSKANEPSDAETKAYKEAIKSGKQFVSEVTSPEDAMAFGAKMKSIKHALTSETEIKQLFKARLKEMGIRANKETGKYEQDPV